jgi:hypothetical protein
MIDAYVNEVGLRLPGKQRADIEREIRSMIEDTLDDESRTQERPIDEAMVVQVLKRLGSPQKLAASYTPPQVLIGPELFPAYILVVKIVVSVLAILTIIGLALSVGLAGTVQSQMINTLAQATGGLFSGIFQAFGIITFVFAVIQRVAPKAKLAQNEAEFDPTKLRLKPDSEKINQPGLIGEIVFTAIAIALFSFFPQVIGVGSFRDGQWVIVPIFSQAFYAYVPYLVALWAAQGTLAVVLVANGRRTLATRWIKVGLNVLGILLVGIILRGPSIIALPPDIVTLLGWGKATPDFVANFGALVDGSIRLALFVALIVQSIETISEFVKLVLRTRPVAVSE